MRAFLRAWLPALLVMGFIFWASNQSSLGPAGAQPFPGFDKLAHATIFGLLAALLARALRLGPPRLGPAASLWLALAGATIMGALDEYHQSFVSGRHADPADFVADLIGALLAVVIVGFLDLWRPEPEGG